MNKTTKKILAIISVALVVCMMLSVSAFAAPAGDAASADGAAATTSSSGGILQTVIMLVLLVVIFYFFLIRPEKKRKKKDQELRASLGVGDKIVTIGGIIGEIVNVSGDNITFETGEDRVRMEVAKWSISRKVK